MVGLQVKNQIRHFFLAELAEIMPLVEESLLHKKARSF